MATLGSLVVSLEANMAKFASDMGRAQQIAEQNMRKINEAAEMAKRGLEAIGIALGARELWEKFNGAVEAADQLQKLSEKSGITVEHLSELQYAAKLSGVDMDGLSNGLKKLQTAMFDAATGGRQQQGIFQGLGVAYKDTNGNLRDTYDVLLDVADRFEKSRDGTTKAAEALKIFGKSGTDLIPLLNEGSEGVRHMAEEAQSMGIVIGHDLSEKAQQFKDDLERMQLGMGAVTNAAMKSLVPAFDDILKAFLSLNAQKSDSQSFWDTVATLARWAATAVGSTWLALKDMGDGLGAVAAQAVAVLHGNLEQAREIGRLRDEQAKKNEEQFKKFQGMALTPSNFVAKTKRPDQEGSSKPVDTTAVDKIRSFIDSLKEQNARLTEGEFDMLRMKAAMLGAAKAAEPLIANMEKFKQAQAAQKEANAEFDDLTKSVDQAHDAIEQLIKSRREQNEQLAFENSLIGMNNDAKAIATIKWQAQRQEMAAMHAAMQIADADMRQQALDAIEASRVQTEATITITKNGIDAAKSWSTGASNALNNYIDKISNTAKQTESLMTNAFQGMEDALVNFVKTGKLDFKSLADSIITDLIRIEVQRNIMGPLVGTADKPGILSQGISAVFSSIFGGGRASGGPVSSGTTYLVGENGPELFTPGASGSITPNGALGGTTVKVEVINNVTGAQAVTRTIDGPQGQQIIQVVLDRIESSIAGNVSSGKGHLASALHSTYGLNRVAGAY